MDVSELEVNQFIAGDAKLHGGMCKMLSTVVNKVLEVFPFIEAARPRSKSGIQALCSLHVAVGKAKSLLRHCADCSKLYLAITGDSICLKFEKARCELKESLGRVEDIVPEEIGSQIMEIVGELEGIEFMLDPSEKEIGDDVISLFLIEGKIDTTRNDSGELEIFHQAAFKLGITSSRAALTERRALKKLIEKACAEGDKRKESIVSYLLNLLRRYSKHFRGEVADDTDSQGSTPCSPTVLGSFVDIFGPGGNNHALEKHFSKLSSLNFKQTGLKSGNLPPLPEEFRCPISLQLMYDPVIISSGQTYERVCIEKWFNDGHVTCPKTQQQLSHLSVTPNYCVKGLIASWCEHNGITIPHSPPESLDVSYWRLALSECEATDSRSMGSINSCKPKCLKVVPLEESIGEELKGNEMGTTDNSSCHDHEVDGLRRYESLLAVLYEDHSMKEQCRTVEQLRLLLKDDEEARIYMGANGVVEALVQFLRSAVQEGDNEAQKAGAMALFNLIVSNSRNKGMLLSSGVLPLLEQMISGPETCESATALYLNLSCLDEAKPAIASSQAIPFLVQFLQSDDCERSSCKHDALYTLYNLSTKPDNIPIILASGFVDALHSILTGPTGPKGLAWTEKALAIFINLASSGEGKEVIASTPGLIGSLAAVLDTGEPAEQEQSVSCLLILCSGDERCSHMVLQEGVVPSLVSLSVSGSQRGRERSQTLLKLFREQRQREPLPAPRVHEQHPTDVAAAAATSGGGVETHDSKPVGKARSKRKRLIQTLSSFWKNKNFAGVSVLECMNRRPCKSF